MAGSILFSVHAPPAIAAELPAAFHVAVSPVDGKINRNVRFLPTQHTTLISILRCNIVTIFQQPFKCQFHVEKLLFNMLSVTQNAFFPRRRGSCISSRRFAGRWQPSRRAPADTSTRPFSGCPP